MKYSFATKFVGLIATFAFFFFGAGIQHADATALIAEPEARLVGTTPSTSPQYFFVPLRLPADGMFLRETSLWSSKDQGMLFFTSGTTVMTIDGMPYSGTINPSKVLTRTHVPLPLSGKLDYARAVTIATETPMVRTDKNFTLIIPFLHSMQDAPLTVYYFNPETVAYEMAYGWTKSADGMSVTVQDNRLGTFVVAVGANGYSDTPSNNPFPDVNDDHWAEPYIADLKKKKILPLEADGLFHPESPISRAKIVELALKAFDFDIEKGQSSFPDVSSAAWFSDMIYTAEKLGIVDGYPDGTFKPQTSINRVEAVKVFINAAQLKYYGNAELPFLDIDIYAWYMETLRTAYVDDIVHGKTPTMFYPADKMTRAEMAKVLWETLAF